MTMQLSPRDLDLIRDVATFKYLDSHQLKRRFFPTSTHQNATRRLRDLASTETTDPFLSRLWYYPRPTLSPMGGHPIAVFIFTSKNKQHLRQYLEGAHRADIYARDFAHLLTTDPISPVATPDIWHELAISDFFLALTGATDTTNTLGFWERTSPFSKDIKTTLTITRTNRRTKKSETAYRHFNPDAVFLLSDHKHNPHFYIVEYDNNTHSTERIKQKYESFIGFSTQKRFPDLIRHYKNKYLLDIPDPKTTPVYFLTVAANPNNDHKRRNDLLLHSLPYNWNQQLLFASITDCTRDTILTPIWLRGNEYHKHAEKHLDKIATQPPHPALQLQLISTILNDSNRMPRVQLLH